MNKSAGKARIGAIAIFGVFALVAATLLIAGTPGSPDDTTADIELGQVDFAHSMGNFGGPPAQESPQAAVVDSAGHLYVVDEASNRVLGWSSASSFTNGEPADLVIGQPDFYSSGHNDGTLAGDVNGEGPDSLFLPQAVAVDADKNLYVADTDNSRVLEYAAPFAACGSFPCVGAPASLVFGTCGGGFTGDNCVAISADSLGEPEGVALDSNGNLYVSDEGNDRVLEYYAPFTGGTHAGTPGYSGDTTADVVFGQDGSFTTYSCNDGTDAGDVSGLGPDSLCSPGGIAVDASNNLYVVDYSESRVLEYDYPFTGGSHSGTPGYSGDTTADAVFGQDGSFTTGGCYNGTNAGDVDGDGPDSLCSPEGVAVDTLGNVYIADTQDSRVLEYNTPFNAASGETGAGDTNADLVFGQDGSFTNTSQNEGTDAGDLYGLGPDSLSYPTGVAVDSSNNLYVADSGNYRVLEYNRVPAATSTNTTADRELGQIDLMHGIFNFGGPSALLGPEGVAVDSSGHVYVTDYGNNRVLGWHNAAALTNGAAADLVIGQPDFYTNVYEGTGAGTFSGPSGIAVDPSSGNLYIADSNDARVLEFNQPFAGFTGSPITGLSASLVFGQGGSFTANYCNNLASATADTLCYPQAVAFDDSGNLYVSDYINNRVLEYYAPFTGGSHSGTPGYSGDTTADIVFGQGGLFTTNTCSNGGVSADSLCEPEGLALDASSNLYVADVNPSRVLEYLAPFTGGTHTGTPGYSGDTTADLVFGQDGSFTTSSCNGGTDAGDVNGLGPDSLCYPTGVALDAFGNLYAIDQGNNRALDYMALFTGGSHSGTPGYSGDTTADQVFGTCGSFTGSSCSGISADSLNFPTGAAVDTGNNLYVADTSDNRVLEYYNPLSLPTQTATPTPTSTSTSGTPTATATATATKTATATATSTGGTPTATATATKTATATAT
ncbi:MAG: hypothetical protein WAL68_00455, partial [Candidatus Binatus sp.]